MVRPLLLRQRHPLLGAVLPDDPRHRRQLHRRRVTDQPRQEHGGLRMIVGWGVVQSEIGQRDDEASRFE